MSIEAMKQWAEGVSKAYDLTAWGHTERAAEILRQTRDSIRTAIEQAAVPEAHKKQEPVAWVVEDEHGERLEWVGDIHSVGGLPTFPLYTSPPASKPWVGLTDEEINACDLQEECWNLSEVARAIEAKLREKNA